MKLKEIDWVNHIIAFGASVVGIFIAFQLDDWQDRRSERQKLVTTLQSIREEVEENISIFQTNDSILADMVRHIEFVEHNRNEAGEIVTTVSAMDSMKAKSPGRFGDAREVGNAGGPKKRYRLSLVIDLAPRSGISTSSWEAAKASGILTSLDHPRMAALTGIYDWTSKRIGVSDEEFMENFITTSGMDNMNIIDDYKILAQVIHMKVRNITEQYDKIDWELK